MHRLTDITLDHPKTAAALLLVTALLGAGVPPIPIEHSYRPLIGENHPAVQAQDAMVERFSGGVPFEIGWECGASFTRQSALDRASLEMANDLTNRLLGLGNISKAYSPTYTTFLLPALLLGRWSQSDHDA